jgi:hypothetical protein
MKQNPFEQGDMASETAELLVDDFTLFQFPDFTPEFLENFTKELPSLKQQAEKDFDWSAVPGATEYDARLARKLKAKSSNAKAPAGGGDGGGGSSSLAAASSLSLMADNDEEEEGEVEEFAGSAKKSFREDDAVSWEKSPAEKARRIFEWWKIRVPVFKYWPTALRLIVLVQPSSAFVERAFSQIKLIIQQIGVSGLEETLEARALVHCNKD